MPSWRVKRTTKSNNMILLVMLEVIAGVLILAFFFTQIIQPLWQGTDFFPMFRKQSRLERELRKLRQAAGEETLEAEVDRRKAEVSRMWTDRLTKGVESLEVTSQPNRNRKQYEQQ